MTDTSVDRLAAAVAARIMPPVPIDVDLWGAAEIARYLKCARNKVAQRFCSLPDFPRPIRLPNAEGGRAHPRWRARDVIAWAESYAPSRDAA